MSASIWSLLDLGCITDLLICVRRLGPGPVLLAPIGQNIPRHRGLRGWWRYDSSDGAPEWWAERLDRQNQALGVEFLIENAVHTGSFEFELRGDESGFAGTLSSAEIAQHFGLDGF
jgi:hypothetical protein